MRPPARVRPSLERGLPYSTHPGATRLLHRMQRCGTGDWNGHFTCRTPGCDECRGRYIGKQRRAALARFADASNDDLAMVTIVVGATGWIDEVADLVTAFRKDLRNVVDGLRRSHRRWRSVEFLMWLETDAFASEDYVLLGSDKQAQLGPMAPLILNPRAPVWIVTFHGIVRLNGLEPQQIRQELERKWGGAKRVDVAPFAPEKTERANLGDIINYALKHQCRTHLGAAEERWPDEWIAEYFAFLHEWSRGFQKLKVSVGRQRMCGVGIEADGGLGVVVHDQLVDSEHDVDELDVDPLPFSCSFSVFDNYYY